MKNIICVFDIFQFSKNRLKKGQTITLFLKIKIFLRKEKQKIKKTLTVFGQLTHLQNGVHQQLNLNVLDGREEISRRKKVYRLAKEIKEGK